MSKNTNGTKELPNDKNHETPDVEENQPSQESPGEGLASVENGKEEHSSFKPVLRENYLKKVEETKKEITVKEIDIDKLKPHPQNEKIYGNEDVSELADSIKKAGKIVVSLVINKEFVIISGHRRWLAAKKLGFKTVPCVEENYPSLEDELEALILYNATRVKTFEQTVREGMLLEKVYAADAKKRRLANLKQNKLEMPGPAISENSTDNDDTTGATRDVVAKKIGTLSGKKYERGKKVIIAIDKLKDEGKKEDAELLANLLKKSLPETEDLAKKIDSLSEDDKNKLRKSNAKFRDIVPKTKNEDVSTKSPSEYTLVMAQLKKIEDAITVLNNLPISREGDKKKQKIQVKIENQIKNLQKLLGTSNSGEAKEELEAKT